MALGLVGRSAVALSAHLNSMFRVLKGTDPDSLAVRLPTAGSFEVRHSATNAAVFQVTDAGMIGAINGGNIADGTVDTAELKDGAVTSVKIADGSIVNADVSPSAAIVPSKLWGGGTADRVLGTTDGTTVGPVLVSSAMLADGAIVNADVNASAGINVSKLGAGGVPGMVVATNDGTNVLMQQISSAMIADQAITNIDINNAAAIAYSKLNLAASITSNDIVDGAIVNADVNAAAGIVASKLAAGGTANRVVATADGTTMALQQVTGSMIANATITSANLGAGITAPACALIQTTGLLASPLAVATFSSIPQTYTSLELRIFGISGLVAMTDTIRLTINGIVTAAYVNQALLGQATAVAGIEGLGATSADVGYLPAQSVVSAWMGAATVWLHGYTSATRLKSIVAASFAPTSTTTGTLFSSVKGSGVQTSTLAVNQIDVKPAGGSWMPGSIVSLYGYV